MSYYPPQGSYSHHPQQYSSSHQSHGGYDGHGPTYNGYGAMPQPQYVGSSGQYPQYAGSHGGANIVYVPSSGHRRRHSRSRSRQYDIPVMVPTAMSGAQVIHVPSSHGHRHHDRGHSSHSRSHHSLTLGERIRRFLGMAPRPQSYTHKSDRSSWGFLGRSRRPRYTDARTGAEVDRKGRPVYRV